LFFDQLHNVVESSLTKTPSIASSLEGARTPFAASVNVIAVHRLKSSCHDQYNQYLSLLFGRSIFPDI
jgi:hypothetical protein